MTHRSSFFLAAPALLVGVVSFPLGLVATVRAGGDDAPSAFQAAEPGMPMSGDDDEQPHGRGADGRRPRGHGRAWRGQVL